MFRGGTCDWCLDWQGARPVTATLTATVIDAMLPGDRLKDDRVPGLEVRCHSSGRSFLFYYRTKTGIARRPKIGNYPSLPLADARKIASGLIAQVAAGKDPSAENKNARHEIDMDALWAKVEAEHYNKGKTWDKDAKRLYLKHLSPRLGKKRVSQVQYEDIHTIYSALKATPILANRVLAVFGKMMKLAEKWRYRPPHSNPVHLFDSSERFKERKRSRFASPDELAKIGAALDKRVDNDSAGVAFLYVLAFSGARPSEIGRATPDMVDASGVLRIKEGKTGERAVYLPAQALRAMSKLPTGRVNLCGRATVPKALWAAVRKEAGCPDLWARDSRRTFATVALSNGMAIDVLGGLLGHKSAQTTKIYALLMEDVAHKSAANVANVMEGLMTGSVAGK